MGNDHFALRHLVSPARNGAHDNTMRYVADVYHMAGDTQVPKSACQRRGIPHLIYVHFWGGIQVDILRAW
jgi:hypothetical protein